jgi:phosphatidylglycerol:prolipoprotein diacylglycerol transferase
MPGWAWFQIAAVVLGGLLVWRKRLVVPYASGVVLAVLGAVALGSAGEWIMWLERGARGPIPELEIAGFGALAGLVGGHVLVARARGITMARALDGLAPSVGAMIAVARIGCFFAGCDFGTPSRLPWALRYPPMTPAFRAQLDTGLLQGGATSTLPVHPTQLYEALLGAVVLVAALALRSPRREGDRFALVVLIYAAGRIVVDVFRGDLAHGGALGLTTTQGLALALVGLVVAWRANARTTATADAAIASGLPRAGPPSSPESRRSTRPTASS